MRVIKVVVTSGRQKTVCVNLPKPSEDGWTTMTVHAKATMSESNKLMELGLFHSRPVSEGDDIYIPLSQPMIEALPSFGVSQRAIEVLERVLQDEMKRFEHVRPGRYVEGWRNYEKKPSSWLTWDWGLENTGGDAREEEDEHD